MDKISMAYEFYRPISRPLTNFEKHDVMADIAEKLRASLMTLLCADGGDCIELNHKDLMIMLYGLHEDSVRLGEVLKHNRSSL